ncbi:hypothetical protein ACHIPZ_25030 [Antrihabitans sp. NCIMB 15449]|uniref:DUF3618 domain-containing protein n=1 Tax=Antrihabitans spumae TaxID=3373370 RepID=A0ABW7JUN2_9NOCA
MTAPLTNPLDIIAREVTESVTARVLGEVEARVADAVQAAQAEALQRIDELLQPVDLEPAIEAPAKDAKSRALRTAVQGGVATVLVSGLLALAGAINGNVDLTSSGDWKVIAGTVSGAVIMAGAAYVQRIINPPRS